MKTAKFVLGLLCIIFTLFVLFQSCAAGLHNAIEESDSISGTTGALLAVFMLAGGIVSVATRKSDKRAGSIASMILFFIAWLWGRVDTVGFGDLPLWSGWCFIVAVFHIVHICLPRKTPNVEPEEWEYTPEEGETPPQE